MLTSVIAHGLTDQPGSEWIGRRTERRRRVGAVFRRADVQSRCVRVLRELSAGADHPWSLAATEGRYLTGLLLRVNP